MTLRSKFQELLHELETEHERELLNLQISCSGICREKSEESGCILTVPRERLTAECCWEVASARQDLRERQRSPSNSSWLLGHRSPGPTPQIAEPNVDSSITPQFPESPSRLENDFCAAAECPDSELEPTPRSSKIKVSDRLRDVYNDKAAQKVIQLTAYLDGWGAPSLDNPLASSGPRSCRWQALLLAFLAFNIYHMVRIPVQVLVLKLSGEDLLPALVIFALDGCMSAIVPMSFFKNKYISTSRAFAAVMASMLTVRRAERLITQLSHMIRTMHARRLGAAFFFIAVELVLVFGPGSEVYRKLALWPLPPTSLLAVLHSLTTAVRALSTSICADTETMLVLVNDHAVQQMQSHLECRAVENVFGEYNTLCDYLDDYFEVLGTHYKYPMLMACCCVLLISAAFVMYPGTRYTPYLAYIAVWVVKFGCDTMKMADLSGKIEKLVHAVFTRPLQELRTDSLIRELHLRLRVTNRRPILVTLGWLEITHVNLFGLATFLLSLLFVIIFELRTGH